MIELPSSADGLRVVVIGDLIADEYILGRVARVSREAPVLILEYSSTQVVPGGAGNAAANVAALGGRVTLVTLVGRDDAGRRVREALPAGVSRRGLLTPAGFQTPVKTRILAGGVHSAKQQVVRIDRMSPSRITAADRAAIRKAALAAIPSADAVLMSDYGSGIVTPALGRAVGAAARRRGIPVLVDSRYALTKFRGLTACAPNESEVEAVLGVDLDESPRALEAAGRALLAQTRMRAVIITRGSRGMAVFEPDQPTLHLSIYGSDEIADVTGAGDTVMATLTLAMAGGASAADAARLANVAGGLVVMKRGTATVSKAELSKALAHA
jgi:rfaE bifunctional protein kinase chain/domain